MLEVKEAVRKHRRERDTPALSQKLGKNAGKTERRRLIRNAPKQDRRLKHSLI